MNTFLILYKKELKSFFLSPLGWIILAFAAIMQALSLSTALKGFTDTPVASSLVYVSFHTPHSLLSLHTMWFSQSMLQPSPSISVYG